MADETQWLNADEMRAWRALLRSHSNVITALDRDLNAAHGLGLPDFDVLNHLSEADNRSLRMTELANRVMLSPSGLTRRLDGLVKQGLVERQPSPSDGRGLLAVLTNAGLTKADQMAPTHVKAVREQFIDCLDESQIRDVIKIFEPIAEADGAACIDDETGNDNGNGKQPSAIAGDVTNHSPISAAN